MTYFFQYIKAQAKLLALRFRIHRQRAVRIERRVDYLVALMERNDKRINAIGFGMAALIVELQQNLFAIAALLDESKEAK